MPVLSSENLSFHFSGQEPILRDVNLRLETGEFVVILGRNGSGKTTLLRVCAGLLTPSEGAVSIDGIPVVSKRDSIGLVFQNPDQQMIAASVEEEIALGMELRGWPPPVMKTRVDELLEQFGLFSLRKASTDSLSGGQKQRVALASVLVTHPDFLFFDEPDSYLDAVSRHALAESIVALREKCGIVWTSPNPRQMPRGDRYFLLEKGSLFETTHERLMDLL